MTKPILRSPGRRGSALVLSSVLLVFVVGTAAFTTDLGFVSMSQARVKSVAEAAASAAIANFSNGQSSVETAVTGTLARNGYDAAANLNVTRRIEFGTWDPNTKVFTRADRFDGSDAVRVVLVDNGVTAFFGGIFSQTGYSVSGEPVAHRADAVPRDSKPSQPPREPEAGCKLDSTNSSPSMAVSRLTRT